MKLRSERNLLQYQLAIDLIANIGLRDEVTFESGTWVTSLSGFYNDDPHDIEYRTTDRVFRFWRFAAGLVLLNNVGFALGH